MNAVIAFIDESGLLMHPLVRRSWAPRGQTPILHQKTRSYSKVSAIAAVTVAPQNARVGLTFACSRTRTSKEIGSLTSYGICGNRFNALLSLFGTD